MNEIHLANVKKLICKTLGRRYAVTEDDLLQIPQVREQLGAPVEQNFYKVIAEMVRDKEIMFMEFTHADLPNTVRTIYLPVGTVVYEPGLSVKERFLPDAVDDFYRYLFKKDFLDKEFFEELSHSGKITLYEEVRKLPNETINKQTVLQLLKKLVNEGKVTLNENCRGGS
jgi:hypothetical protein